MLFPYCYLFLTANPQTQKGAGIVSREGVQSDHTAVSKRMYFFGYGLNAFFCSCCYWPSASNGSCTFPSCQSIPTFLLLLKGSAMSCRHKSIFCCAQHSTFFYFFYPHETRTKLTSSRTSPQGTYSSCTQVHQPFICPLQGHFSRVQTQVDAEALNVHFLAPIVCIATRLQKWDKQKRFHIAKPVQLCAGLITDCPILFFLH